MAAALSPDGRTLMIDLQGSLWTLPASGGPAQRVTDEYLDARQPAWAPDNRRVAFQGYADGVWHIYVMNADGIAACARSPRARSTIASRRGRATATASRSRPIDRATTTSSISTSPAATVRQLTKNPANDYAPAYSPVNADDRVRQRARGSPRRLGGRCRDGDRASIAPAAGAVSAPSWNPDGSQGDLQRHRQQPQQPRASTAARSRATRMCSRFARNGFPRPRSLYTADGKIKTRGRCRAATPCRSSSRRRVVHAHALQGRGARFRFAQRRNRCAASRRRCISPDGTQVAFIALGDLWLMPMPSTSLGQAARAPSDQRSLRRDASDLVARRAIDRVLVRSRRHDGSLGARPRERRGQEGRVRGDQGVVGAARERNRLHQPRWRAGDHRPDRAGSRPDVRDPGRPTWAPEGWIAVTTLQPYSTRFREGTNQLLLVSTTGGAPRRLNPVEHHSIGTRTNDGPVWSRDGSKMAFVMDGVHARHADDADGRCHRRAAAPLGRHGQLAVVGRGLEAPAVSDRRAD